MNQCEDLITTFSQHLPFPISTVWDVHAIQLWNKVLGFGVWSLKNFEDTEQVHLLWGNSADLDQSIVTQLNQLFAFSTFIPISHDFTKFYVVKREV